MKPVCVKLINSNTLYQKTMRCEISNLWNWMIHCVKSSFSNPSSKSPNTQIHGFYFLFYISNRLYILNRNSVFETFYIFELMFSFLKHFIYFKPESVIRNEWKYVKHVLSNMWIWLFQRVNWIFQTYEMVFFLLMKHISNLFEFQGNHFLEHISN